MYHLLSGLYDYLTRKDEYSVVIIGLDNAGKTTMLEKVKTLYNPIPGMPADKIGPTVGQNIGKISLPQTTLHFFDLGGQRDIRQIWEKYYDECHAVVFVLDACDQGRLGECWEVFDTVLTSPRLLNLPLLLLANKQDSPTSLSPSEIRESFDAWHRSRRDLDPMTPPALDVDRQLGMTMDLSALPGKMLEEDVEGRRKRPRGMGLGVGGLDRGMVGDFDGAKAERVASLDVLGVSALNGDGVKDAVNWLYLRVRDARKIDDRD